ncbi:hypothetical protein LCGC14_2036330 [marine sediment metagenome]|uniref:Uncharacterized protein n=1 Tax=marine sediment metagenome TaxID=412755 RepID=A0A0F9FFU2_9ZZZZ
MKTIWLIIPGADEEAEGREAPIEPGTTAAQLLRAADMNPAHWQLRLEHGDEVIVLGAQDDVYSAVEEGEKVFAASTKMVVGQAA